MIKDWRPSFILAYVIFTAVLISVRADGWATDGGGAYTISLIIMSALLVIIHVMMRRSRSSND